MSSTNIATEPYSLSYFSPYYLSLKFFPIILMKQKNWSKLHSRLSKTHSQASRSPKITAEKTQKKKKKKKNKSTRRGPLSTSRDFRYNSATDGSKPFKLAGNLGPGIDFDVLKFWKATSNAAEVAALAPESRFSVFGELATLFG
jgi:hypothetical protein